MSGGCVAGAVRTPYVTLCSRKVGWECQWGRLKDPPATAARSPPEDTSSWGRGRGEGSGGRKGERTWEGCQQTGPPRLHQPAPRSH